MFEMKSEPVCFLVYLKPQCHDHTTAFRLSNVEVILTNNKPDDKQTFLKDGQSVGKFKGPGRIGQLVVINSEKKHKGKYVLIVMRTSGKESILHLMEIKVFGLPPFSGGLK